MNLIELGEAKRLTEPRAKSVSYADGVLTLELIGSATEGAKLSFPARALPFLAEVTEEELAEVEVVSEGATIYWRRLDEGARTLGIVKQITGLQGPLDPVEAGAKGGKARSATKTAAARENGKKGAAARWKK